MIFFRGLYMNGYKLTINSLSNLQKVILKKLLSGPDLLLKKCMKLLLLLYKI